ncbi:hypothetical protein RND81_02G054700 [Saponaria officinalis]|uniref:GYF domain-containing protein n=3 Tax=Saponaria officinalis TaxID=3572 RepID=A0AAW1MJN4_SAPOF
MAASSSSLSSTPLSSPQISQEMPGPDNPIPLSPQWLHPKQGETKVGTVESHPTPPAGYSSLSDVIKSPGNGDEMNENQKKKDVFRPTFMDMESGRRDRWRDEERDTNSSVRKDRWREGDNEIGDSRKGDRWVDNSPGRHFGEARRAPTDRRGDPNRESNQDPRHGNKWSSRWGPGDKEMDKWTNAGKNDVPFDKGPSHSSNHGKNEREGDHYRPWRPSSLQGRGRGDPLHHHAHMAGKEAPTFNHGRGRGDNAPSTFSASRERLSFGTGTSGHPQSSGVPERGDNGHGESSPFRYSRTKLLDIFRVTDLRPSNNILDGLTQAPSLTQEEPLEPLAVCLPTPEESSILKGIDKGDIISSGAPQISKDGSSGRSSADFATSRQRKLGSREDVSSALDDAGDKVNSANDSHPSASECLPHDLQMHPYATENKYSAAGSVRDDSTNIKRGDEVFNNRDAKGHVSAQSDTPWRRSSVVEPPRTPSRADMSWSPAAKDGGEDSTVWRRSSVAVDRELESKKLLQTSPEDLVLHYKDPQGLVQGPFTGADIIGWFEAGYFGIDLEVRLSSASIDSPFSLLGDMMPHLRAKARPPPGFNTAKQTEVIDVPNRLTSSGFGSSHPGGIDFVGNEHRHALSSSTEAENRYLESLMSGEISSLERLALKQGLQGFKAPISIGMPTVGAENVDALALLAQKMNLDRQKQLSNSYPYWPPRDAAPVVPSPDANRDSKIPLANPMSSVADVPRQSHPLNVEKMSPLQGLSDRSSAGMNNGLGGLPNFLGGSGTLKDKVDLPHGQNFPQATYGLRQHMLQPQNQPSVTNLLGQTLDSQGMTPEKLLSSGLVQDPQLLHLLQQQYLLQLQSQQSGPDPQQALLDRMLFLQQQQKQEEQQKLFLQQQQLLQHQQLLQQQQLLSKVLAEQQLAQRFGTPAFGQLQVSAPLVGNAPTDSPSPQLLNQLFQVNPQIPIPSVLDNANTANISPNDPQDLGRTVPSESNLPLHLPHQMLGGLPKVWPSDPAHTNNQQNNNSSLESVTMENFAASEAEEKTQYAISSAELRAPPSMGSENVISADNKSLARGGEDEIQELEVTNNTEAVHILAPEEIPVKECNEDVSAVKDANVESREVKKTSEKKSKKQKSAKGQSSTDQVKATSKGASVQRSKKSEDEKVITADQPEVVVAPASASNAAPTHKGSDDLSSQHELLPAGASDSDVKEDQSVQGNLAHKTWKPAVSVKPKSLLEIQLEEQQRSQMEISFPDIPAPVSSTSSLNPWGGVVAHSEPKVTRENSQNTGTLEPLKSKKSGLHDLLTADVLAKSSEKSLNVPDLDSSLPPLPVMSKQLDLVADDNFIEAKDTKKSRKKAAKAKGASAKVSSATSSADLAVASSPVEKVKSSKPVQAEKEVLPAPSSGPSLGDFVPWKGESTSPSSAPAWVSEPAKFPKPTSLRDILREQEKKVNPKQHPQISTPQKTQSTQTRGGSRSVLASSPSKTAAPVQISFPSTQTRGGEDDLFWGPPEQSKQESKPADFPQLGNHRGRAVKSTPVKGTPEASLSRQKSAGGKALDNLMSFPPASERISAKGKKDDSTKHSEAVDFRDWCESESVRLTGSRDTSFLEFCSKQSKSEAEMLLKENLGSFDPSHEFIEKFLNYMEMLPAEVLEAAFQIRNDLKAHNNRAQDTSSDMTGFGDYGREKEAGADGSAGKGGKKKGKKGKKVSPSVLGFNVVSNRIMMGEIQTLDD